VIRWITLVWICVLSVRLCVGGTSLKSEEEIKTQKNKQRSKRTREKEEEKKWMKKEEGQEKNNKRRRERSKATGLLRIIPNKNEIIRHYPSM